MLDDFKFIFKKPALLVSLLAIALLPVIYAVTFLGAMWNPYERTQDLNFHIVNEDTGTEDINIGNNIEEELEENDQLNWKFTSLEEAEQALHDGQAYGYILIPSDASENAETFLTDDAKQVNLELHTNPGYNVIGSIMAEQAGSELENTVRSEISSTYTSALIEQLGQLADRSDEAGQAITDLKTGAEDLDEGIGQVEQSAGQLSEGANTLYSGEQQFSSQLEQLAPMLGNYGTQLISAQNQLESGAGELNNGLNQMTSGVGELKAGSNQLSTALEDIDNQFQGLQEKMENENLAFTKEGADAITNTINLTTVNIVEADTYAQGFAPLIISISVFIGAITFNVVYPTNKQFGTDTSIFKRWIGRGLLILSHSLIISVFLYIAMAWGMQIGIADNLKFFTIMFSWAVVSITLISALVTMLGNVGKYIGIILLVLQLAASGGTFPIETANNFYQKLFEIIPMAYTVTGFKEAIFDQSFNVDFSTIMLILGAVALISYLVILLFFYLKKKFPKYKDKITEMSRFES